MLRTHIYYIATFIEKLITTMNHGWLRIVEPIDAIFYEMVCNVHWCKISLNFVEVTKMYDACIIGK